MRKTYLYLGVIFVLILTMFGCSKPSQSTNDIEAMDSKKVSLILKWLYDPGFAGEMVAEKGGLFADKGLEVDIKPGGFEIDPVWNVISGSSEFGHVGADTFLLARANGLPVVAISAGYIKTPVTFYALAETGIKHPDDFVGGIVGVQNGQDTKTAYIALMNKLGIDRDDIKEVPVEYDFSVFLSGQVDVWPGYAASQSYILDSQGSAYNMMSVLDYGLPFPGTVYITSEDFVQKSPEYVDAFRSAVRAGWQKAYADEDMAVRYIHSYDPDNLTEPLIRANMKRQKPQIMPDGYKIGEMRRSDWDFMNETLKAQGLIDELVDLDKALLDP